MHKAVFMNETRSTRKHMTKSIRSTDIYLLGCELIDINIVHK